MSLPQELHNKIVDFLLSLPNIHDNNMQRALIYSAGLDSQLQHQITIDGPPAQFVRLLVSTLLDYGKLEDGRHALEAVLEAARNSVGQDRRDYCDTLIQEFQAVRQSWPALVKLVLEADLAECNETTCQNVVHILASLLTIERDSIHILHMEPGSRDVIFELPTGSAMELVTLFQTHSEKLVQLEQQFLVKEVILLSTEHGPRFAVCQWERQQRANLDILDRTVPLEKHYQVLPLLREVKKERLPHELRKRKLKEWNKGAMLEMEEEARYMMSDMEEGIRDELRPMDILRWEEELREEQVTYEKVTLEQVFKDFRSVAKEAKSAVPRFVVLGPPGSGKTTLVQYLAWQSANRKLSASSRNLIPARLRLREWEAWAVKPLDPENSLPEYLAERYKDLTPTPTTEQWRGWLQQGDVLLLLDGLDEISGNQSFLTALKTALDTFKDCPTVLTCRTVSFDQHQNLCPDFSVFTLAGLVDTQRNAYIHIFPVECPDCYDPDALIEQLNRTPQMRPLAANPLLLSIICYVVDHPRGVTLPARRGELYAKAIEKLLTRPRRHEVTYPGGKSDLPLARKRCILEHVAFRLFIGMEQQRHLTFNEDSLLDALTDGVKAEKLTNPADVADTLLTDLTQNSGILRGDAGQGYFFLHLTVQEFLTAAYLAKLVNKGKKGWKTKFRIRQKTLTIQELVDKKAWDPRWQEVITLLAGQLKEPAPLLKMLSLPDPTSTNPYSDDLFRHRLSLAALCLTELASEIHSSHSKLINYITTVSFSLWLTHSINTIDDSNDPVPHLTRILPALGQVNGLILSKVLCKVEKQVRSYRIKHIFKLVTNHLIAGKPNNTPLLGCLADLLQNRDLDKAIVKAVGKIGSIAATPAILVGLADLLLAPWSWNDVDDTKDIEQAVAVMKAVSNLGSAAATPEIIASLADLLMVPYTGDADRWWAAVEAVKSLGSTAATPEILAPLIEMFFNSEGSIAYEGAGVFGGIGGVRRMWEAAVRVVEGLWGVGLMPELLTHIAELLCDEPELYKYEDLFLDNVRLIKLVRNAERNVVQGIPKVGEHGGSIEVTPEIVIRLTEMFCNPKWEVRRLAMAVVRYLGDAVVTPEILTQLADLLDSNSERRESVWLAAMVAVERIGSAAATLEILARLAEIMKRSAGSVLLIHELVVEIVGKLGKAAVTPTFLTCLTELSSNPDELFWRDRSAPMALAKLGSVATTPELLARLANLLSDSKWKVREATAMALGKWGSVAVTSELLACLTNLLSDPERTVRLAAAMALGKLGSVAATPEVIACLADLLDDPNEYLRQRALAVVEVFGSAAATPEILACLVNLLCDSDKYMRVAAAEAVGSIGSAAATPEILTRLLDLLCDPEREVWQAAAEAVGGIGSVAATPEVLDCLAELLSDLKSEVRQAAGWVVGGIGSAAATPEIITCLVQLLGDPTKDGQRAADALAKLMAQDVRIFEKRRWFFRRKYEGRTVAELSKIDD